MLFYCFVYFNWIFESFNVLQRILIKNAHNLAETPQRQGPAPWRALGNAPSLSMVGVYSHRRHPESHIFFIIIIILLGQIYIFCSKIWRKNDFFFSFFGPSSASPDAALPRKTRAEASGVPSPSPQLTHKQIWSVFAPLLFLFKKFMVFLFTFKKPFIFFFY